MQMQNFDLRDVNELKRLSSLAITENVKAFLLDSANNVEASLKVSKPVDSSNESKIISTTPLKNYGWDQNNSSVKIYLTIPYTFNQDGVEINVTSSSLSLIVKTEKGFYELCIRTLFSPVLPNKHSLKIKGQDLVLTLSKKEEKRWDYLSAADKPKVKEDKPLKSDSDDPQSKMMDLMRKMYEEGDDNMKRTMNEAWAKSYEQKQKGINSSDDMKEF